MKKIIYIILVLSVLIFSGCFIGSIAKENRIQSEGWWFANLKHYSCIDTTIDRSVYPGEIEDVYYQVGGGCKRTLNVDNTHLTLVCYAKGEKGYFNYFSSEKICEVAVANEKKIRNSGKNKKSGLQKAAGSL